MTLTLPAFLDALVADLKSGSAPTPWLTYNELANALTKARAKLDEHPTHAIGWSEWLEWAGEERWPLPGNVIVEIDDGHCRLVGAVTWAHVRRFRYRCDPSGWLPRGDFVPPAALWDEACPVRCEWTCGMMAAKRPGTDCLRNMDNVTHIRLLPREKAGEACEMPEGFHIGSDGNLYAKTGLVFTKDELFRYGPDTIRRAIDGWLASMKERGNG